MNCIVLGLDTGSMTHNNENIINDHAMYYLYIYAASRKILKIAYEIFFYLETYNCNL